MEEYAVGHDDGGAVDREVVLVVRDLGLGQVSQIRSTLDFSSPVIMIPSRLSGIESSNRLDLEVAPLRGYSARWWSPGATAPSDAMVSGRPRARRGGVRPEADPQGPPPPSPVVSAEPCLGGQFCVDADSARLSHGGRVTTLFVSIGRRGFPNSRRQST